MATASSATLSLAADGVVPMTVRRRSVLSAHDSGQVHARQVQSAASKNTLKREIRSWRLTYNYRTETERGTLRQVWVDSLGGVRFIDWTPPDEGSAIQVRLIGDTYRETMRGSLYFVRFELEEVL